MERRLIDRVKVDHPEENEVKMLKRAIESKSLIFK